MFVPRCTNDKKYGKNPSMDTGDIAEAYLGCMQYAHMDRNKDRGGQKT